MKRIEPFKILEELYGLSKEDLIKLDNLCKEVDKDLVWYDLFYIDAGTLFTTFPIYVCQKYHLTPKKWWLEQMRFTVMTFGPTCSETNNKEALEKVKDNKEIMEIVNKAKIFGDD